jgi:hypothetical protein
MNSQSTPPARCKAFNNGFPARAAILLLLLPVLIGCARDIRRVAVEDNNPGVRRAAVRKLDDPSLLAKIASVRRGRPGRWTKEPGFLLGSSLSPQTAPAVQGVSGAGSWRCAIVCPL